MHPQRNLIGITLALALHRDPRARRLRLDQGRRRRHRRQPAKDTAPPAKKADVRSEVGANGLPTPAALLARYVDAIGGESALRKHQSSTRKGKMAIAAMGMEGTDHHATPPRPTRW